MLIKQISIFIENRKGRLAEITEIIAKNNINLRSLSIADTSRFGVLRVIVDDPNEAEKLLKESGLTVSVTSVLSVRINDAAGGLSGVLKLLSDNGISIEYMYAFTGKSDDAYLIMRVDNDLYASQILKEAGYSCYNQF